ncbi:LAGLIDADG family homing endonuclease [Burkholderia multivorans]|uniref:LAGLIDADG family homing endonuclease n=1 Tax=Burkholderia multivorans TaxID=87883 RepID=UPI001C220ADC|nr:LAGLIDADG family homing endonuclease [Burkholderia multivorans]
MAYTEKTQLSPALEQERALLLDGKTYSEIAKLTGARLRSITERNRLVYRVDVQAAFRRRVERDGIANRYIAGDAFGNWFAGYFDGEGCLTVFYRERDGIPERRIGVQISCRYDDADVLTYIKAQLGVGVTWQSKAKGATKPAVNWRVESAADLAEVIVPLLDVYPLRSKKRLEFMYWRPLVIDQYVNTLGGTSTRIGATVEQNVAFQEAMQNIRNIRHPA